MYVYSNSHTVMVVVSDAIVTCTECGALAALINHWILLQLTRSISGSHKIGLQFPWPWINLTDLVR